MNAPLDPDKLAAVLGMLGSAHEGEVLNAARQAERMRRDADLSWQEILAPARPASQPVILYDRDALALALGHADLLNEWELGFVRSLSRQRYPLSDKQVEILDQIVVKIQRATAGAAA